MRQHSCLNRALFCTRKEELDELETRYEAVVCASLAALLSMGSISVGGMERLIRFPFWLAPMLCGIGSPFVDEKNKQMIHLVSILPLLIHFASFLSQLLRTAFLISFLLLHKHINGFPPASSSCSVNSFLV